MMLYGEEAVSALEHCSLMRSWIGVDVLQSMIELNIDCLALLAEQAQTPAAQSNVMLRQYRELWRQLDTLAQRLVAATPFLLLDVGFADASRWVPVPQPLVSDGEAVVDTPFFTIPRAVDVAHQVFHYVWDLSRTQERAARVLTAAPSRTTRLIRTLTIGQVHELGERHAGWLLPRWHKRAKIWRAILTAAASHDLPALEHARQHGLSLIAAEARMAMAVDSGP